MKIRLRYICNINHLQKDMCTYQDPEETEMATAILE